MQMPSAYFFYVDVERNIITSDSDTHKIKIFSKEGNHIWTIGERGQQPGMFYTPQATSSN